MFFRHLFHYSFDIVIIRGDIIKKNIGIVLLAIILAFVFSKVLFSSYDAQKVMKSNGNIYLLQYASFINKDVMEDNISKLENYVIYEDDNKYYVYLGAFVNYETAKKMQKFFENQNIYVYIKNDFFTNSEIIDQIKEIDNLILNEDNHQEIINYNKKILNILKK